MDKTDKSLIHRLHEQVIFLELDNSFLKIKNQMKKKKIVLKNEKIKVFLL